MRIPNIINPNTLIAYEPSKQTLRLKREINRKLRAEDLNRQEVVTLITLCLRCISKNVENYPNIMEKLLLCADVVYILEILSPDLPLSLVVPLVEEEVYWKRRYNFHFGQRPNLLHRGWTWKCIYLEKHISRLIERAHADQHDEDLMADTLDLVKTYIHRIVITELQAWKPPAYMPVDEIPDIYPNDHVNLEPIFSKLPYIEDLELSFVERELGVDFSWHHFVVNIDDAKRLGSALLYLKRLRVLNIHSSDIGDHHVQVLVPDLIKVHSLEELIIANCKVGDRGALCIAKMLMVHPRLERLSLYNNRIGALGGEGIGYALMQTKCSLKYLNLRMNPLTHRGVMGLLRAIIRVQNLEELVIAGCGFDDVTSFRVASLLQINRKLKYLDLSNNWCAPGQMEILDSVLSNSVIQKIDLRECDISAKILAKINHKLTRNRGYDIESPEDSEFSLEMEVEEVKSEVEEEELLGSKKSIEEEDLERSYIMSLLDPKSKLDIAK